MRRYLRSRGREHYRLPWNGFASRLARQKMGALHWAGLLIIVAALSIGLLGLSVTRWPSRLGPWWQEAISAYGWYAALVVAIWVVIIAGNRIARRRKHPRF